MVWRVPNDTAQSIRQCARSVEWVRVGSGLLPHGASVSVVVAFCDGVRWWCEGEGAALEEAEAFACLLRARASACRAMAPVEEEDEGAGGADAVAPAAASAPADGSLGVVWFQGRVGAVRGALRRLRAWVAWEGVDPSTGRQWEASWVACSQLSADMQAVARRMATAKRRPAKGDAADLRPRRVQGAADRREAAAAAQRSSCVAAARELAVQQAARDARAGRKRGSDGSGGAGEQKAGKTVGSPPRLAGRKRCEGRPGTVIPGSRCAVTDRPLIERLRPRAG